MFWSWSILVPRVRHFFVTWLGNEGLWKYPLPDVRKFLISGRACAEVTNITTHAHNGFLSLTAPLGKNFTSWALSREWLLWDVLKMHHFAQPGFTDNLELKEEDSNWNRLNTLLVCRTETINRQTIVWVMWVFFNTFGEQTLGKIDIMREKVNLKRYLVPCPATAILLQNAFWNETIQLC